MTSPNQESRIINQYTPVFTPMRWHVSAYCVKNQSRNFMLSLFRNIHGIEGSSDIIKEQDCRWNTKVNTILKANPRLIDFQRSIVEHDYAVTNSRQVPTTRPALIPNAIQILNIDLRKLDNKPEAQQIVVDNLNEVKKHAF